jgi:hypothetical protein
LPSPHCLPRNNVVTYQILFRKYQIFVRIDAHDQYIIFTVDDGVTKLIEDDVCDRCLRYKNVEECQ